MRDINEFLASINIYRIQVPIPYPVGPINSYLIKKEPYTLIDTGTDTDEAKQSLVAGLAKVGVKPEQIKRIVLTHFHTDHSGLAKWMNELYGSEVYVHKREVRKLQPDYDYFSERIPFLKEAGLSEQELNEIYNDEDPAPEPILPEQGVTLLNGGELWEYDDRKLRIVHVPGHSSGHIGVLDEDNRVFFAGDFILKHITPNPFMEAKEMGSLERLPVLAQYINSIELFAGLPINFVLPGHGSFIEGNREIAAKLLRHHRTRLDKYQSLIRGREITAQQLMRLIYPEVKGFEIFLAASEVVAHLDYLVSGGLLNTSKQEGICYYSLKNNLGMVSESKI